MKIFHLDGHLLLDVPGDTFRDADLRGADLRGANLEGADMYRANLEGATLQGANLRCAFLHGAYMHNADLRGVDFRGANMCNLDLHNSDLSGADLRGTYLQCAHLFNANVQDADFTDAMGTVHRVEVPEELGHGRGNMNPLLFIHTWQPDHDNGNNDMCRGTFLYTWGYFLSHRFVFDNTRKWEDLLHDEMRVNVDSGLTNTSYKTKLAIEWAYLEGYSHVCYAPTDCYFIVPRLLRNLTEHAKAGHDYWGFHTYDEYHIGGGSAYWLSRKAMEAVLAFGAYPDYEDRWIGEACRAAGIEGVHDERYRSIEQPYLAGSVTVHLSESTGAGKTAYDPEVMKNLHLRVIKGAAYTTEEPNL